MYLFSYVNESYKCHYDYDLNKMQLINILNVVKCLQPHKLVIQINPSLTHYSSIIKVDTECCGQNKK